MALAEGWGKDGIQTLAQGSVQANSSPSLTHQVDAIVDPVEIGWKLSDEQKGRIVVHLAQYAPHFHSHVVFARKRLIQENPGLRRAVPQGLLRLDRLHEGAQGDETRRRRAHPPGEPCDRRPDL